MDIGTCGLFAIRVLIPKIVIKLQNTLISSGVPRFVHESAVHQFFVNRPLLCLGRLYLALAERCMSNTRLNEFIFTSVEVVFVHV